MQQEVKGMQKIVKINLEKAEGSNPWLFLLNRESGELLYSGELINEIEIDATIETLVVVIDKNKKYKAICDDGI